MHENYPKLYNLIESLTYEESEKFEKEFLKKESKEFQLFNLINIQIKDVIEPDEVGLETLEKNIKSKDLRTLLRDTKDKLIDFLDDFHSNLPSHILTVRKLLDRTNYLLNKELYDLANESWQEARGLAIEHKIYDEYTRVYRLGLENSFRNKSSNLKEDIKEFAEIAFNLAGAMTANASSPVVFGSKEMVVSEIRKNYLEEYQKLIKSLSKSKEKALQEEVMQAFGLILQHHIKDRLHNEPIRLAKEEHKDFYQDWFYRLIFTYLCLNRNDNKFFFEVYTVLEEIYKENPTILLPESEIDENEDDKSNNWAAISNPYANAWWLLQNFELFYYSFGSGYEDRAELALQRIKQNVYQNAFTNPIKYSALGYFLARKISSLEIALKLKSGEGFEGIKSIVKTMPEDLILFSENQITKTALRYELNLILLKFLSTYGNGQNGEKESFVSSINALLNGKKILTNFPEYEADLRLMKIYLCSLKNKSEVDNEIRSTERFLKKKQLDKDFRKAYLKMIKKFMNSTGNLLYHTIFKCLIMS
jgi:hypothetical protein